MILLLDTGILGQLCHPNNATNQPVIEWLKSVATSPFSHRVFLPEICDYELRRKLLHLLSKGQTTIQSIRRLDELHELLEFLPVDTDVFQAAASLWAEARSKGIPTAQEQSLDCDVILAAQAGIVEGTVVTTNRKHLQRFVPAFDWPELMCQYAFICISGDVDNLVIDREECFVVLDVRGRAWFCREAGFDVAELTTEFTSDLNDMTAMYKHLISAGYREFDGMTYKVIVWPEPVPLDRSQKIQSLRESLDEDD